MTALHELTLREAAALLKSRQLSPVELTQAHLDRIRALDGKLLSFVTLLPDSALAAARTAEAEIGQGRYRGPLHGIPLAHKDLFDTKGVRTTAQSKVLEHRVPTEDATAVARLHEAGSVMLGKLAMYEFAIAGPQTSLFQAPRNPWNLAHIPAGSSSGSGVALAAGLCMGSLGSDTAGSVRSPAAACGIVGLKPTYGRVSRFGVLPLSWSLDHAGPMARTVEDAALMLQVIAGYDPRDPTSSPAPVPDYSVALREDVKGLRIGVPAHFCYSATAAVAPETRAAVDVALTTLTKLGAHVEEVTLPALEHSGAVYNILAMSEAFAYHRRNLQSQPQNYVELFRRRVYLGALFTANDLLQAQRARRALTREMTALFGRIDLLALPSANRPAPTFTGYDPFATMLGSSLNGPFNLTGVPALSLPCGFSPSGLPIGLQLAAAPFAEPILIRAAYTYQQATDWHKRHPPL